MPGSKYGFTLVRYNMDGSLDETFGVNGKAVTDLRDGWDTLSSLAVQRDGKIVAAGASSFSPALVRFEVDGALDVSFGTGGKVITDTGYAGDPLKGVVVQDDGRIVVGAYNADEFVLERYWP